MRITRRATLTALALPLAAPALGQTRHFVVISHAVHRNVLTTGPGGDATAEWRRRTGMEIE